MAQAHKSEMLRFFATVSLILAPEKRFYAVVLIYGVVISLFTLVIPVSVQALISTVTNTLLLRPVIILSIILVCLLLFAITLHATQIYVMEMMERHLYARITKEMALRLLYADPTAIEDAHRTNLANRYFEIMHMQKTLPSILVRGFALILQTSVGLIVVSFYHESLFALNLIIFLILYTIWRGWKVKAFRGAFDVSTAKYETARVLGELARSNPLFRSNRHLHFACQNTNSVTKNYIKARRRYFRSYFSQHIGFLLVYALGSTALLSVGGWLVIREQLTIGQLVAAELIMSAIFYAISRFAYHLADIYELFASCAKLSEFYKLPMQKEEGTLPFPIAASSSFVMEQVRMTQRDEMLHFSLQIAAGEKIMAHVATQPIEVALLRLFKKQVTDYHGRILFNDVDLLDIKGQYLQDSVIVIDNHYMAECTIKEWLLLSNQFATHSELLQVLQLVELYEVIGMLPDGINTALKPYGHPLHFSEMIKLKLAAAILAQPAMLVINGLFDALGHAERERIMQRIVELPFTFIYFTNGRTIEGFDRYMLLNKHKQVSYTSIPEYEMGFE